MRNTANFFILHLQVNNRVLHIQIRREVDIYPEAATENTSERSKEREFSFLQTTKRTQVKRKEKATKREEEFERR